ncbi:MAG: hypothetical protein FD174_115 [Geobacteraceae bacterium]|nr:MAG: hypothetical protein FD174_115 [Geobacteraceae bacterium]
MKPFSSALFYLMITATAAFASEASFEKNIARGIAAIESADYPAAVQEFQAAVNERPDDPEATLYLGIALNRARDKDAETVLKKALAMAPDNPRTNMELGILYFNRQIYAEAADYFDNAMRIAPGSELSAAAEEYLRLLRGADGEKRWWLKFMTGMQYDSNVVLNADGTPLPQGISRKSDWRGIINLRGNYSIAKNDQGEATVGYSLYQSLHTRLDDFNITQNLVDVTGRYDLSPLFSVKAAYTFEYLLLGGDTYDYAHSAGPSFLISEGEGFSTVIDYRFRDISFRNTPLFTDNTDRTGTNHQVGITQNLSLATSAAARVGYYHDEDRTRREFWDYSGDKGLAGLTFVLPLKLVGDLYGEIYNKRYRGTDPSSGVKRDDTTYTGAVSASKFFAERYSLTLGFLYTRNRSNSAPFDYSRNITSLFFNARF